MGGVEGREARVGVWWGERTRKEDGGLQIRGSSFCPSFSPLLLDDQNFRTEFAKFKILGEITVTR